MAETLRDDVFAGSQADYETWVNSPPDAARLIWESRTERRKLSTVAEAFFRRLKQKLGGEILLLHRLIPLAKLTPAAEAEIREKLDELQKLFEHARPHSETTEVET